MEISIIIPVYNKREYLEKCLQSIFSQQFHSFEVVIVDDGSTDGSGAICDRWAEKEKRLKVYHIKNSGVTAARRYGVEYSRSKYVMFSDADDLLMPNALSCLHQAIEKSGADEVIGNFQDQYNCLHDSGREGFVECHPLILDLLAIRNSFCVLWGIIFRRELLEGCLNAPREIIEREDSLMQIKCLMKKPRVFFIKDIVYLHYEDVPNQRKEELSWIRIYDEELKQTLLPQWEQYNSTFVHHQIKIYEKFIDNQKFHVFYEYYKDLRKQNLSSIPLVDRIIIALPPQLAYWPVHIYKWWLRRTSR